ncbi:MAG: protein translocase subunit SecF [Caldisericia bacterium]|nr:protein translocase subunit SecF [Caldisericia bacterium]
MRLFSIENLQFIPRRKFYFSISLILILISIIAIIFNYITIKSPLNYGLDFTGGTILDLKFEKNPTVSEARDILKEFGYGSGVIQVSQDGRLIVRINQKNLTPEEREKIFTKLEEKFGKLDRENLRLSSIGPTISSELKRSGIIALLVGLSFIFIYITLRFQFRFAVVTILALIHDTIITVGLLALIRQQVNSPFIGALLAIIAYSVQDSVVVLDRVRENLKILKDKYSYDDIINISIQQSFTRSLNTSLTTLLAIIAILIFGGSTIRDFSFTLLFGITAGTYSSIFIAAPLLVVWNKLSKHKIEEVKKEIKISEEITKAQVATNPIKINQNRPKNKKKKKGGKK